MRKLVYIHGWSDNSHSFQDLMQQVQHIAPENHYVIKLADFTSLDDSVTFDDLTDAMQQAWQQHGLHQSGKNIDVITHSTGGLILRAWLQRYYPTGNAPIAHVLMLAPPHFGSHLAHKGRAFFGRLFKGFGLKHPFEVGEQLLQDLEMASPYTWQLAMQDCFGSYTPFHADDIMLTIGIGGRGYHGMAAAANLPGSDGVVPLGASQLSGHVLRVSYDQQGTLQTHIQTARTQVAFMVFPDCNHSTILHMRNTEYLEVIHQALTVQPRQFANFCQQLQHRLQTWLTENPDRHFQQTIVRARNQYQQPITDYYMHFAELDGHDIYHGQHLHNQMVDSVHTNTMAPSYRAFHIDVGMLESPYASQLTVMGIGLTAHPNVKVDNVNAGYLPCHWDNARAPRFSIAEFQRLFAATKLLLIDWEVPRMHSNHLFEIHDTLAQETYLR